MFSCNYLHVYLGTKTTAITGMKQSAPAAAAAAVATALGPPVVVHGEVHMLPVVQASPLDVSLGEAETERSWTALANTAVSYVSRGGERKRTRTYESRVMRHGRDINNNRQTDKLKQTITHESRRPQC